MKAELPITKDYLPTWGVWEGLREIIQNGIDEEVQNHESVVHVNYDKKDMILTVQNTSSILDRKAFLFGHTTKAGDASTIGEYGEGLKLGVLALVREKKNVSITVGKDLWTACFIRSRKYGCTILGFNIKKDVFDTEKDVSVSISPVTPSEYDMVRDRFVRLMNPEPSFMGNESGFYGRLISTPSFRGRIYVKGVWVADMDGMEFGYNFHNVTLNRDRNFVAEWDISYHAAHIIDTVLKGDFTEDDVEWDVMRRVYKVMQDGESDEADRLSNYLSMEVKGKLASMFREQYGEKSVPVCDNNGVRQAEFCGAVGVVVPKAMADTLAGVDGMGVKDHVQETVAEVKYTIDELTVEEREKLETACLLVSEVTMDDGTHFFEVEANDLNIVDFNKETTLGLWQFGKISIARKVLEKPLYSVLMVVVHEVLHGLGDDGTRSHSDAQAELLARMVEALWRKPLSN